MLADGAWEDLDDQLAQDGPSPELLPSLKGRQGHSTRRS